MKESEIKQELGAVTFLDVLGWKGIWQKNDSAIEVLYSLQWTNQTAKEVSHKYSEAPELRGKAEITNVLSISDTIALFTSAQYKTAIEIQAKICAKLLSYALEQGYPHTSKRHQLPQNQPHIRLSPPHSLKPCSPSPATTPGRWTGFQPSLPTCTARAGKWKCWQVTRRPGNTSCFPSCWTWTTGCRTISNSDKM